MIGMHLSIDGWRKDRDEEGWRIRQKGNGKRKMAEPTQGVDWKAVAEWESLKGWVNDQEEEPLDSLPESVANTEDASTPQFVPTVPRLASDMQALKALFQGEGPLVREVRCRSSTNFYYGFGDASGTSFGSSFEKDQCIEFEFGQWCTESSEQSSNWRELKNVVEAVRGFVEKHDLYGAEIFIFTDNTTAEGAFWKGITPSRRLFNLVLELREL
mmetsp:Transcript_22933/g.34778  ORF Transcript_22933/g.34778 Transcript_22933/m.34778 type:complete len:214 (-) Transcript_22933:280-921(-)